MDNMDWNSFFSAFSQSAAAIIGIIAAFLISKILGENEKLESQTDAIDRLVIKYNYLKSKASIRSFEWYDRRQIEYSSKLTKAIEKEAFEGLNKEQRLEKLYEIMPILYRTPACEEELDKRLKAAEPIYFPIGNGKSLKQASYHMALAPNGLWDNLSEERELIDQIEIESRTLINKFKKLESGLHATRKNLIPLKNAIYLQSIAFLLTVVYPLHFMPMVSNTQPQVGLSVTVIASTLFSFKGVFLLLLCLVVLGIFGYFLHVIVKLQRAYDQAENSLLPEYMDVTKYSEYFRNNPT